MAAFLGDIAFLLGIVVASAGLFTLHRAAADPRPALLKTAGYVLLVAGIATALCTTYYYARYHFSGDLDHAYPAHLMRGPMMQGGGQGMMKMMMGPGMGRGERAGPMGGMETPGGSEPAATGAAAGGTDGQEEHEAHHPQE
jgi:hypothetical protein